MSSILNLTSRVHPRKVELLSKGQKYSLTSLLSPDVRYTPDVVEHFIRYFWPTIEGTKDKDENIEAVYIDITSAISSLPPEEKRAVDLMIAGYEIRNRKSGIANQMGIPPKAANIVIKRAYTLISQYLEGNKYVGK